MNRRTVLLAGVLIMLAAVPAAALPLPDGLENALRQIQDFAAAVKSFSSLIYDIIAFFTRLFGFGAILLLVASLVTSSGLVAVGVPAGRLPFIISLSFWDGMWVLWTVSSGGITSLFIGTFLSVNAKVAAPFAAFELIRFGVPFLWRLVKRRLSKGLSRAETAEMAGRIAKCAAEFSSAAALDLSTRSGFIVPSKASLDSARELSRLCDDFCVRGRRFAGDESAEKAPRNDVNPVD